VIRPSKSAWARPTGLKIGVTHAWTLKVVFPHIARFPETLFHVAYLDLFGSPLIFFPQ